jgi:hypothetical protein
MFKRIFWPSVLRTAECEKYYFQQDGARPHTTRTVQTWLKEKFNEKLKEKDMWLPRYPDLNSCDFYLWGHLKSLVFNPLAKTLDDLKVKIEEFKRFPKIF